ARAAKYRENGVHTYTALAKLDYATAALTHEKIPVHNLLTAARTAPKDQLTESAGTLLNKRGDSKQRAIKLMQKHGFHTVNDLLKLDELTARCAASGAT